MGTTTSTEVRPEELTEFADDDVDDEESGDVLPQPPENRTITDKKWIYIYTSFLVLLSPFWIYSLTCSKLGAILTDLDDCGNSCGGENEPKFNLSCSGQDMSKKLYLLKLIDSNNNLINSTCISNCTKEIYNWQLLTCTKHISNYSYIENENIENETRSNNTDNKAKTSTILEGLSLILTTSIAIILSVGLVFLLKYNTKVIVWSILFTFGIICLIITGWLWGLAIDSSALVIYGFAISMTVFLTVIIIITLFLYKKIPLIILLFEEAVKCLLDIPLLSSVLIIISIIRSIVVIFSFFLILYLSAAVEFELINSERIIAHRTFVMKFSVITSAFIVFWSMLLISGIEHMIIGGAVSTWFFTRNKKELRYPLKIIILNTIKFHLGTAFVGSLILMFSFIIHKLISFFLMSKLKHIFSEWLRHIEHHIYAHSTSAYIFTSIHGLTFLKAGHHAADLFVSNAKSLLAMNSIGDFVLLMAQLIVILISCAISYSIVQTVNDFEIVFILAVIINIVVVTTTFSRFETIFKTLFLCFCEDKLLNDGVLKPYFMSQNLMQFADRSNAFYEQN